MVDHVLSGVHCSPRLPDRQRCRCSLPKQHITRDHPRFIPKSSLQEMAQKLSSAFHQERADLSAVQDAKDLVDGVVIRGEQMLFHGDIISPIGGEQQCGCGLIEHLGP